jgi:general secretion pathway protein D
MNTFRQLAILTLTPLLALNVLAQFTTGGGTAPAATIVVTPGAPTPAGPATSPTPGSTPVISVTPGPAAAPAATALAIPAPAAAKAEPPEPKLVLPHDGAHVLRGNDRVIAAPSVGAAVPGGSAGLKFEDAPLGDVVHIIMREMAKVTYLIHPPISGTVTLSTQGNISTDDAVYMLENALLANGFVMAQDSRGTYHIGRPEVVKNIVPNMRQAIKNTPIQAGHGAIIVPLKYIGAAEMASILQPMAQGAIVRIDTVRNLLVMVGNRAQAEGWLDIVNTFDVDMLKGMSVAVIPLKFITTKEVDLALRVFSPGGAAALGTAGGPGAGGLTAGAPAAAPAAPTTPGAPAAGAAGGASGANAAATQSAQAASFPLFGALRIVPLERMNSVIVITPRAAYIDEIRLWIEKIDRPGASSTESQLFVYPVQNGNAAHLTNVLNGLFGSGTASQPAAANAGVAPALGQAAGGTGFVGALMGNGAAGAGAGGSAGVLNANAGRSTVQGAGITTVSFTSGLRLMADGVNNAILIYGTAAEYAKVEATLKRLDVPGAQVLIEATIMEVSLKDDLQYGLQWAFSENRGGNTGKGTLSSAGGNVPSTPTKGFSYSLTNTAGDIKGMLNLLADKSLLNVISSPSLMVLDNHTASIAVGTQQPVNGGTTITTGGVSTNSIQYKDTGVNLTVTPSINAGNMVNMTINQSVTDVGDVDSATGQRSFLQRQIGSKVAVRSGETIVLGGLIRDNSTTGRSGIPILQDLPLVGGLFSTQSKLGGRTEMLVMLTPRVVRSDAEIGNLANDVRDSMKGIDFSGLDMAKKARAASAAKEAAYRDAQAQLTAQNDTVKQQAADLAKAAEQAAQQAKAAQAAQAALTTQTAAQLAEQAKAQAEAKAQSDAQLKAADQAKAAEQAKAVQLKAELDAKAAELAKAAEAAAQPVQCGPAKPEESAKNPTKKKLKKPATTTTPLNCAPGSTTPAK